MELNTNPEPKNPRPQFIADYLCDVLSVTGSCELYGVSRKICYKWMGRYIHLDPTGLREGSRHALMVQPNAAG